MNKFFETDDVNDATNSGRYINELDVFADEQEFVVQTDSDSGSNGLIYSSTFFDDYDGHKFILITIDKDENNLVAYQNGSSSFTITKGKLTINDPLIIDNIETILIKKVYSFNLVSGINDFDTIKQNIELIMKRIEIMVKRSITTATMEQGGKSLGLVRPGEILVYTNNKRFEGISIIDALKLVSQDLNDLVDVTVKDVKDQVDHYINDTDGHGKKAIDTYTGSKLTSLLNSLDTHTTTDLFNKLDKHVSENNLKSIEDHTISMSGLLTNIKDTLKKELENLGALLNKNNGEVTANFDLHSLDKDIDGRWFADLSSSTLVNGPTFDPDEKFARINIDTLYNETDPNNPVLLGRTVEINTNSKTRWGYYTIRTHSWSEWSEEKGKSNMIVTVPATFTANNPSTFVFDDPTTNADGLPFRLTTLGEACDGILVPEAGGTNTVGLYTSGNVDLAASPVDDAGSPLVEDQYYFVSNTKAGSIQKTKPIVNQKHQLVFKYIANNVAQLEIGTMFDLGLKVYDKAGVEVLLATPDSVDRKLKDVHDSFADVGMLPVPSEYDYYLGAKDGKFIEYSKDGTQRLRDDFRGLWDEDKQAMYIGKGFTNLAYNTSPSTVNANQATVAMQGDVLEMTVRGLGTEQIGAIGHSFTDSILDSKVNVKWEVIEGFEHVSSINCDKETFKNDNQYTTQKGNEILETSSTGAGGKNGFQIALKENTPVGTIVRIKMFITETDYEVPYVEDSFSGGTCIINADWTRENRTLFLNAEIHDLSTATIHPLISFSSEKMDSTKYDTVSTNTADGDIYINNSVKSSNIVEQTDSGKGNFEGAIRLDYHSKIITATGTNYLKHFAVHSNPNLTKEQCEAEQQALNAEQYNFVDKGFNFLVDGGLMRGKALETKLNSLETDKANVKKIEITLKTGDNYIRLNEHSEYDGFNIFSYFADHDGSFSKGGFIVDLTRTSFTWEEESIIKDVVQRKNIDVVTLEKGQASLHQTANHIYLKYVSSNEKELTLYCR